jgi:hypothetical protein
VARQPVKRIMNLILGAGVGCLLTVCAVAADAPQKKLTCCETAAAAGKECSRKCCVAAHKQGKSCEKCNPNKEDLKLKTKDRQAERKAEK